MKPKRQEDSSCVFAYRFCRGTCHRRDTAGKAGKPRKTHSTKAFRLRQSIISAEIRRKRCSLPMGEVRPAEHDYDYKEISLYDHKRYLHYSRYPGGQAGAA